MDIPKEPKPVVTETRLNLVDFVDRSKTSLELFLVNG